MNDPMTNEREAQILDRFVARMGRTDLDLFSVTVLSDLISALAGADEGKILTRLAATHVVLEALELEHGEVSEYEAEFLRVLEQANEEDYDDDE